MLKRGVESWGYNLMLATQVDFLRGLNTILIYAHRGSLRGPAPKKRPMIFG